MPLLLRRLARNADILTRIPRLRKLLSTAPPPSPKTDSTMDNSDAQHALPIQSKTSNTGHTTETANNTVDLTTLTPTELIARINELETRLKTTTAQLAALSSPQPTPSTKQKKVHRPMDFSRYSSRYIALRFAYLGHRYNGLEHANGGPPAPQPTIEEALWKALRKARLIPTDVPQGCDASYEVVYSGFTRRKLYHDEGVKLEIDWNRVRYSKCGRTDKGVSAFGQVVGLVVRSNRPKRVAVVGEEGGEGEPEEGEAKVEFDDIRDELPYVSILNSVLPSDIRVLAWCPKPGKTFDARFSCKERRYKYFFTNPAFCPMPGEQGLRYASGETSSVREGWLDIEAMRTAAKKLEGLHDYRNFCKIDASKQMAHCERRIIYAGIEEMASGVDSIVTDPQMSQFDVQSGTVNGDGARTQGPKVYAFAVHGTAFLWHQVRCMVAIMFLVGQGLEKPEIVDELLDIARNPSRPHYEMADDASLVLWDCVFPDNPLEDENGVDWVYPGDEASVEALRRKGDTTHVGKFGPGGLVNDLWTEWRNAKMKETLTAGLLGIAVAQGNGTSSETLMSQLGADPKHSRSQRVFGGDDTAKNVGEYVPVMARKRMEPLDVQNAKYAAGKQARRDLKKSQIPNDE